MSSNWATVIEASTAHLTGGDTERLIDIAKQERQPFRVHEVEGGFIVSTAIVHASGPYADEKLNDVGLSADFGKLLRFAASRDASLIVFDRDVPALEGFDLHEDAGIDIVSSDEAMKKMLDLSTEHMTPGDWDLLSEMAADDAEPLTVVDYEYGYVVSVCGSEFFERVVAGKLEEKGLSHAFVDLMRYASRNGATVIQFDRDAEHLPGFPVFSEEAEAAVGKSLCI